MAMRKPVEPFPPGEILKDELEARGWTQLDLAEIIGRHANTVNEIVMGKRGISPEMAQALAAAFGTSAELWMNLDSAYQLSRVKDDDDTISRRAKVYAKAPVKEMIRRGWIETSDSVDVLQSQICRFFRIESIDDEPEPLLHAAKKSTAYSEPMTPSQTAWLYRVRNLSEAVQVEPYSDKGFAGLLDRLRLLFHVPQEVRHVPRILSDAGIKFVVVQPLPGSQIDGACLWINGSPTVALSLRFDRIDNFWFVLLHELDHLSRREGSLDSDLEKFEPGDNQPPSERKANAFAAETLVPSRQLESFIARVGPFYSAARIEAFAQTMGVHPAVVVGQLQHRGEIAYSSFRKTMVPVRQWITSSALTDGWGVTLSPQS